ncbi:Dicer-like protein 2 [Symbiodinium microadriaticum]|uniref:Dicer-like protein 2 n=1 Tax=Symbiodinium microadriaticum TaxID=2951 RepID=A0A1Q9EF27_SYMMI|nr:Dicer-like protein 2 [Symbiodinium microadriaticum]
MGKTPHPWQQIAAARAAHENIIVSAETGSGKTLVAELAILEALRLHPSKHVAFMVTASRLLAHQQWMRVKATLHEADPDAECAELTGFTASGWGPKEYASVLRAKVLVGTVETFTKAFIDHGFFRFEDFSLFVLDECHEAKGESPAAELLWRLHCKDGCNSLEPHPTVRVMGLTASFASCKASSRDDFAALRQQLQAVMQSKMHHVPRSELPSRKMPSFHRVAYVSNAGAEAAAALAGELTSEIWQELQQQGVTCDSVEKVVRDLGVLLLELGSKAFLFGLEKCVVAQLLAQIEQREMVAATKPGAEELTEQLAVLERSLATVLARVKESPKLRSFNLVSGKAQALLDCLGKEFADPTQTDVGMCFVNEACLSVPLANLVKTSLGIDTAAVSGTKAMPEKPRNDAFHAFANRGACKLLVATKCAEEGLDVADCSFVVRFSRFHTTRNHIQGVGRARASEAKVYYFENEPQEECSKEEMMYDVAAEPDVIPSMLSAVPPHRRVWEGLHPYIIPESLAEVNLKNAISILSEYVARTTSGKVQLKQLRSDSHFCLPGPRGWLKIPMVEVEGFFPQERDVKPTAVSYYVGVLVLHCRGWLDEHNCVSKKVSRASREVAWREPEGEPETISLGPMVFPKGLLGNLPSSDALAQFQQRGKETRRQHEASGAEQVVIGQRWLQVDEVYNTQETVNWTFTDGRSVWQGLKALARREVAFGDITKIRVALDPDDDCWYSADNRRLFSIKVVGPLIGVTEILVDEINWTPEMKNKLDQHARYGEVWRTDAASISQVRKQLEDELQNGPAPLPSSSLDPKLIADEEEILGKAADLAETEELATATASPSRESAPIVLKRPCSFPPPRHPPKDPGSTRPIPEDHQAASSSTEERPRMPPSIPDPADAAAC